MATTALEFMMRNAEGQARLAEMIQNFRWPTPSILDYLFKAAGFRERRIPHTDDMVQMLDDLGIEASDERPNEFVRRPCHVVLPLRRREYSEPAADHVFDWTTVRIESRLQLREGDEVLSSC